jgi:hypothetical protein
MNPIFLYLQSYPYKKIKLLIGPIYFSNQNISGLSIIDYLFVD